MLDRTEGARSPAAELVRELDLLAESLAEIVVSDLEDAPPLPPAHRAYVLARTAEALLAEAELLLPPFERGDRTVRWLKWVLQALRQRLQRGVEMSARDR
jgi:hypothetical protein